MSQRYPGGLINRSAPVVVGPVGGEGGSAPGIWTLEQASSYIKQGLWPKPILPRSLYSWGFNGSGGLGVNNTTQYSSPVQVGLLNDWTAIVTGTSSSAAIKTTGTLWTWGSNDRGQLGQNNTIYRSSPTQVGSLTNWRNLGISTDGSNISAVKTDNTLWAWGFNNNGQLGDNSVANKSSPIQIGSLTNWLVTSCATASSYAVKTNGTLWSWGRDNQGQLGLGTFGSYTSKSSPTQVGALTNWLSVSGGAYHVLATKTDGTLWAWGQNNFGQVGANTSGGIFSSPVQIGSGTTWSTVSAGGYSSFALKTDGTIWAWGLNNRGQLGQNNKIDLSSPVQVGALTTWLRIAGGYNVKAISTIGRLWSWGSNSNGQLGLNTSDAYTSRSSPVQVGSLTTWLNVSTSGFTTLALRY